MTSTNSKVFFSTLSTMFFFAHIVSANQWKFFIREKNRLSTIALVSL